MNEIKEIESIIFGILSPKEIVSMAVCKVDTTKLSGPGSVYDERMGPGGGGTTKNQPCLTCGLKTDRCPGHLGYIEMNECIIHPLFYKYVVSYLRCFCIQCNRLLITEDQIVVSGLNKLKGGRRFKKLIEKLDKVNICCQEGCGNPQPKITYSPTDNTIAMVYKEKIHEEKNPDSKNIKGKKDRKISIALTVDEIKKMFDAIPDEDVRLCGFDPSRIHPRNMILSIFPVIPPCARPFVMADGNICDDDLTNQIIEIIKANNILFLTGNEIPDEKKEARRLKAMQTLKFRISTFYNNSQGRAKHPTNGRAIKGIKERITGKEGQIRNHLMGKRSVTPDTPVLMFQTGKTKRADQIVIGDIVVGDDGFPRKVVDTLEGRSPLYKVKQSHGDDYGISCEHILTLKYCGHTQILWCSNIGKCGGWYMKWYERKINSVKSIKIYVSPYKSRVDCEKEMKEYIKKENIKDTVNYRWCPTRKTHGTFRLNYTKNGQKKSKEIAVKIGKTREEAFKEIEKLKDTINVDPIIDIHVKDYLKLSLTAQRLMLGVKLNRPIKWSKKEVKLDPRILGMWLGDGTCRGPSFTSIDKELVDYWSNWSQSVDCKCVNWDTQGDKIHYGISSKNKSSKNKSSKNKFTEKLRHYNLIKNKHIPEDYIINDEQTRLLVLAGLIDTDGSVEQGGVTVRISQCYEHKAIIDGAKRIADSLGFRTSINIKKTSWRHKDILQKGEALVLSISGNGLEKIPTLLSHKKCRSPKNRDMSSYKISIEEDGVGKYFGFEVDKNNRFLLGDYTITHNCEQTGRTVITAGPDLPFGTMGLPRKIAEELTIPEIVTDFNKEYLSKLVNSGKANFLLTKNKEGEPTRLNLKYAMFKRGTTLLYGDVVTRGDKELTVVNDNVVLQQGDKVVRDGQELEKVYYPCQKKIHLQIGDAVHRHLKDGDTILLNRQPTLHKGSMMAKKIKVVDGKTFSFNLATCKSFNADFDGDEMNIHVAQSLEARAELEGLSATKHNVISAQGSTPNIAIVQDSLAAAYLMTKENKNITRGQFFDISTKGSMGGKQLWSPAKMKSIRKVLKMNGKKQDVYNGKGLISLILPEDFIYEKKNGAHPDEPVVKIYRGVMYEGALDKSILGSSHNSLIQVIHKEYGVDGVSEFITNIQFITNAWLLVNGFSIGLEDCLITSPECVSKIQDKISKCYVEAAGIEATTHHSGIREVRITAALSKAKDIGMKIAKESMSKTNNFLSTVYSGSKGDFFNIAQITGLLGQQNLLGQRVAPTLNHGKRTLPHYPFENMDKETEYESRGFVRHSFIEGLNPQEFYFHCMSGREGICDTAMGKLIAQVMLIALLVSFLLN
jgi:DNA-directed RNA polymerase beta' subunit